MQAEALAAIREAHDYIAVCVLAALPLLIYVHVTRSAKQHKKKAA